LEECNPGIRATGFNVLVAVEPAEQKTAGGIILPDATKDKNQIVQQRGRIVSVGPVAFDFADFAGSEPKPGDAIMFAKLAGFKATGKDDREYRVILDRDVAAMIEEDA
jgi:chaperonin GroES